MGGYKFKEEGLDEENINRACSERQPATVRFRRKIREGISVISSRRVMVRARFKAGAKNVSASQQPTPPSHHLNEGTHPPT